MQELGRPDHVGSEGEPDGLVAQANPQDGDLARQGLYQRHAYTGILGPPRAGRDHDPGRSKLLDVAEGQLVVAPHDRVGAELAQVLDEVVHERVVVIDYQDFGRHKPNATGPGLSVAWSYLADGS